MGVVIIVLSILGWRTYQTLTREKRDLSITIASLRESIKSLEGNLSLTEYEKDKLTEALTSTEEQTAKLAEETQALNGKVSDYEKLQSLDPELLKKYSKVYFLNEHYVPSGLVEIDAKYINGTGRALQFHENAWPYLQRLLDASKEAGLGLLVSSSYRSFGTQAALKASYRITYGAGTANQFSADQGYSEHQLGTTVDFSTKKTGDLPGFQNTAESTWLLAHAHEYGFVLSYPKGNKYYIYEPWHWRFVGIKLATKLHDEGKTLYELEQRDIDQYLLSIFD